MQDPQIQLLEMGLTFTDPVEPTRPAVLDAAHRSYVNWEVYFFAGEDTKRRFDADPLRWCGHVTDPVSHQRFVPGSGSPRTVYEGRPYFFYTPASADTFLQNPPMFATVNFDMMPM
ncbi:MAG TPA: hypothetical protein VMR65_08700 [Candidatus Sulfotelmatobacter sp.]|nr:hypothetical protein [Candidatus Sulfotelmatobacter sp.]